MVLNADIAWAIQDVKSRAKRYAKARDYYAGNHRLLFATEKFQNAFGDLFREFADNLCDDVVDEPVDRLQVLNWTGTSEAIGAAAQALWEDNRGDARAGAIHLDGFRQGDGFLIVWPDPDGTVRFYPQRPEQMAVHYDDERPDLIEKAAKVWADGPRWRINLYYPDRIERYASKGATNDGGIPAATAFQPYAETPEREPGEAQDDAPEPHIEPHGWGMPVFHFPNVNLSDYGCSVLDDVIPLQDALNKSIADMLVAMEFHAYPQRWATGVQVERDPLTGKEVEPFRNGAERLWRVGNKDATFGAFPLAELDGFLKVQGSFRMEIARKGALPPYAVDGGAMGNGNSSPSGISLLVQEGRLVKRVKDRQRDWEPTWCQAMALGLVMSGMGSVTAKDLDIEWAPAETRDEKGLAETVTLKRELGVSKRQGLLELGYDEDKIAEMEEESQAAAADAGLAAGGLQGGRTSPVNINDATMAMAAGLTAPPMGPVGAPQPVQV